MRRSPLAVAAFTVALALGTAACGDDGEADSPTDTSCPPSTAPIDAAEEASDTTLVGGQPQVGGQGGGNPNVGEADRPGSAGDNSAAGDAPSPGDGDADQDGDFRAPEAGGGGFDC